MEAAETRDSSSERTKDEVDVCTAGAVDVLPRRFRRRCSELGDRRVCASGVVQVGTFQYVNVSPDLFFRVSRGPTNMSRWIPFFGGLIQTSIGFLGSVPLVFTLMSLSDHCYSVWPSLIDII